ncbi:MAG: twin-arginine translocation signal domain-containing protein [Planctomycetes bacterium]|nr:twin-arginine translocation signal domain-containing protein [Planctomycetota bacterium]NOG52860.1 2Fe-2S iron-sulfur cluster binding domain-containing protein [Planctomycetota bacterium]
MQCDQSPDSQPDQPAAAGPPDGSESRGVSRRSFIKTMGVSAAAGAVETALVTSAAEASAMQRRDDVETLGPQAVALTLSINGTPHRVSVEPLTPLVEVLRWNLGMTGTKTACGRGACGACTVHLDGQPIASCMTPVIDAVGCEISTIEGLGNGDQLDPLQVAFIKHDAMQCGFCTPGLIMSSKALLADTGKPNMETIRKALCGNLCRCGTYPNVFNAVLEASGQPVPNDLNTDNGKRGG